MEIERGLRQELRCQDFEYDLDNKVGIKNNFIQDMLNPSVSIRDLMKSQNIATDDNLSSLTRSEESNHKNESTENVETHAGVEYESLRNSGIRPEDIKTLFLKRNDHSAYQGSEENRLRTEDWSNANQEVQEREQVHALPSPPLDESLSRSLSFVNSFEKKHEKQNFQLVPQENALAIPKASPLLYEVQEMKVTSVPALSETTLKLKDLQFKGGVFYLSPKNKDIQPVVQQKFNSVDLEKCDNAIFGTGISTEALTINQYVDLRNINSGVLSESKITVSDSSWNENCCIKLGHFWAVLLLAIVITTAVTASCLIFLKPEQVLENEVSSNEEVDVPANYTLRLVSRSQWSSNPNVKLNPLTTQPARYIVVCHTASIYCKTTATCTNAVRNIESWHIQIGLSTAWYNFMIGGDGFIYEGRGWDKEGEHSPGFNCASIGVAFLGNFDINQITPSMIEAYNVLIEEGIRRGTLVKDYKMVGHFQVKSTASPGQNLRELIKTWRQWGHLEKKEFCS
uniref:Peptidoglycan-recognition protein S2-like protein n=1 Tax=Anasa tristis TaxID=236421 RepID=I6R5M9_ANATI|nr:peptidoglycan-recognition protein S2-like protein [Anasa tristis]